MPHLQQPPAAFATKKRKILSALSVPDEDYSDLSPKGSVDVALKDVIEEINAIDGLVTTSSCAGRISVFLEGIKASKQTDHDDGDRFDAQHKPTNGTEDIPVPGGKGLGGRWLFVSHEQVDMPRKTESHLSNDGRGATVAQSVHELFSLSPAAPSMATLSCASQDAASRRLAKFQFEPMILHVMCASLHHAQPLLAAALSAGFRESGVQSLKALDDPRNSFPMVAIRTAGLGLSSIIGCVPDTNCSNSNGSPQSLVSEDYLAFMLQLGNERFADNTARIDRFRSGLRHAKSVLEAQRNGGPSRIGDCGGQWEDAVTRAERKKREGLERQQAERMKQREQLSNGQDAAQAVDSNLPGDLFSSKG